MKRMLVTILLLSTPAHAEKVWTHLPDGRWMFVEQNKDKMCDFQGKCYPDSHDVAPQALVPPAITPHNDLPQRAQGTGCGHWPLGSDADLDCRRMSLLPTAQIVWRLDPNNRWVQINPSCGGRWERAPTGIDWQWKCVNEDWRRDPAGRWQLVPQGGYNGQ